MRYMYNTESSVLLLFFYGDRNFLHINTHNHTYIYTHKALQDGTQAIVEERLPVCVHIYDDSNNALDLRTFT